MRELSVLLCVYHETDGQSRGVEERRLLIGQCNTLKVSLGYIRSIESFTAPGMGTLESPLLHVASNVTFQVLRSTECAMAAGATQSHAVI
jgi:hypothetical protein